MNTFFQTLTFWHWFGLGVLLVILDVSMGANFVLLWSGLVAVLVGMMMLLAPSMGWQWQLIIFGIGDFLSLAFWRYHLKKTPRASDKPHLNQRATRYIGRELFLETPIEQGRGKVRIDDTSWLVQGEDAPQGTKIKIIAVDGMVLIVEKI